MTPTATIVKDRTGLYFSVPKEIIKETNGYDSFHVSSEVVVAVMDDMDDMDAKGKKMNAVIHNGDSPHEARVVYCMIFEIGGDALVLLEH